MPEPPANSPQPLVPQFRLRHDPWGRLVLIDAEGNEHIGVTPVRSFPVTAPDGGLAIVSAQGSELVWVPRLADLPADSRELLEAELSQREFVPIVRRILRITSTIEPAEWEVETDRGVTTFLLKSDDDVRRLDAERAMIIDASGVRYVIPDTRRLDSYSRRVLERYL
jgi:hypothetical protein